MYTHLFNIIYLLEGVYSVYTYIMRANIFIRKDNEEAWEKIKNKSEWVNNLLQEPKQPEPIIEPKKNIALATPSFVRNNAGACKNGHPIPDGRDRCMGKGCKYS